jgi:hypothetical protein
LSNVAKNVDGDNDFKTEGVSKFITIWAVNTQVLIFKDVADVLSYFSLPNIVKYS